MAEVDYHRSALRILFILAKGAGPHNDAAISGYGRCFRGESKVHALDFWMRYPEYLADELISLHEAAGDPALLAEAEAIFAAEEPDLRRVPMLRYYFGAYEPLDTVLGILKSRGLVLPRSRPMADGRSEHDFLVHDSAYALLQQVTADIPEVEWYDRRADLVVRAAGARGGFELKARQHQQKEYHEAARGDLIPSVAERVRKRLEAALGGGG